MSDLSDDPRSSGPRPPFGKHQQNPPSTVHEVNPPTDYGEDTYRGTGKLKGRVAIVTGGDAGIGRAVSIAFAREGADVVLSFLHDEQEDARETSAIIERSGVRGIRALLVPGDLTDLRDIRKLISAAVNTFGRLDIVVNTAGYQMVHEPFDAVSPKELDRMFRTSVFATYLLSQAALKVMRPGAVILNTTSIQAYDQGPYFMAYAATKAAILSLTKSFAAEAIHKGVRVNAVAPGPVWTPLIPSIMPSEKVKSFGANTAFGRPAQPVELARIYAFLASDDASYVTGEVYGATGGRPLY